MHRTFLVTGGAAFLGINLIRHLLDRGHKESFVSIDKARRALGWEPRHSNVDALLRNLEWYRANKERLERGGAAGVTHRVPWNQGLLRVATRFF